MHARANNLPREVNRAVKEAALAVDQTLVMATPVDTGQARSNWLVSLNEPREQMIPPYAPTHQGGLAEAANAQAAIEQGRSVIGSRSPGASIHITNSTPYIGLLNDGWSSQAPANFVEAAVDAGVHAVRNVKIDTGR